MGKTVEDAIRKRAGIEQRILTELRDYERSHDIQVRGVNISTADKPDGETIVTQVELDVRV